MVVTVPVAECAYQAIQIGSRWYVSTDYEHHQTSLTRAQSQADPDGMLRYVISERDPGVANWLETCGHPQGVMMLRWQRLSRVAGRRGRSDRRGGALRLARRRAAALRRATQVSTEQYTARIADRQVGIARRMIS